MKIKTFIVFTIFSFLLVGCPGKNVPPKNNQSEYSKKSMYWNFFTVELWTALLIRLQL